MKWMVAADLHGSAYYCRELFKSFDKEQADRLLLLGDILYHGPRNDLPKEYDPKKVISLLNKKKKDILCVRGNCDTEVDQTVLEFPIMADYCILESGGRIIYATHGHTFGEDNPPPLYQGEVLLCGHTHIPKCVKHDSFVYMNPGSIAIPKEGSRHGYMIIWDGRFIWKDLEGNILYQFGQRSSAGGQTRAAETDMVSGTEEAKQHRTNRGRYHEPAKNGSDDPGLMQAAGRHIRELKKNMKNFWEK